MISIDSDADNDFNLSESTETEAVLGVDGMRGHHKTQL